MLAVWCNPTTGTALLGGRGGARQGACYGDWRAGPGIVVRRGQLSYGAEMQTSVYRRSAAIRGVARCGRRRRPGLAREDFSGETRAKSRRPSTEMECACLPSLIPPWTCKPPLQALWTTTTTTAASHRRRRVAALSWWPSPLVACAVQTTVACTPVRRWGVPNTALSPSIISSVPGWFFACRSIPRVH